MAKTSIIKKCSLDAHGILVVEDGAVSIENTNTGKLINLSELLSDFADKFVNLHVYYDEDYEL